MIVNNNRSDKVTDRIVKLFQKERQLMSGESMDLMNQDLRELGIEMSTEQTDQLYTYYEMLVEWNQFMNLTAITDFNEVIKKHFIDSLSLVKAYDINKMISLIDVGTGAGFPGLVLKIAFPDMKVTLLDSLQKRIQFLDAVVEKLKLQGIDTVHGRAEDFAKAGKLREQYDLSVSRAVANLSTLSEYCMPFVRMGGCFIPYKSEKMEEEMKTAQNAIRILGGKVERQVEFQLPGSDIYRNLVVIRKEKPTPAKYPRKAGLPSREPLF